MSDLPVVLRDILPRERAGPLRRRLAAIAFLDVVGYTKLMAGDDETTLRRWTQLRCQLIEPGVRLARGRIANRMGDGLFIEFPSALDAFRWAVGLQEEMAAAAPDGRSLAVRIALHLGDVIDDVDGSVQGEGVNTAARLQSHAGPGGVILSEAVANEVAGKTDRALCDGGLLRLRHIARPVHVFHVRPGAAAARAGSGRAVRGRNLRDGACDTPARSAALRWIGVAVAAGATMFPLSRDAFLAASRPDHSVLARSPRREAERLSDQGRAVRCTVHPCASGWLAARALYERAIAADPTYGPAYAYDVLTYTNFIVNDLSLDEAADLQSAKRLATAAMVLAPEAAVTYRARGAVLALEPDRLQDALAAYMRSLAIEPGQPVVLGKTGWMLILLGRPAEAETYLKAALAAAPDDPIAPAWLTYLGWAELFLGRPGHGADQFRRAILLQSPGAANGDIAMQRSISLASALALNGDLPAARQLVAELRRRSPTLSIQAVWNCDCSRQQAYLAGVAMLRQGAGLAGLPDTP